jgi:hypothetical protein
MQGSVYIITVSGMGNKTTYKDKDQPHYFVFLKIVFTDVYAD